MIRHSKDGYCISLPFVVKCSCKPPEKTTTLLPPVITTDNNLITAHRIGWIIWTHQIIKKMRYQIYEAKSVKHDAQQRVGIKTKLPGSLVLQGFPGFSVCGAYQIRTNPYFCTYSASISATSVCLFGYRCEYVLSVVLMSSCPSRSLIVSGDTPNSIR